MRRRFRRFLDRIFRRGLLWLNPGPDLKAQNRFLQERLETETEYRRALEKSGQDDAAERIAELIEARQMAGSGPWTVSPHVLRQTDNLINASLEALKSPTPALAFRESDANMRNLRETALGAIGAYNDVAFMLQNVEWRREINVSWLEFSRWGIQQLMLISRLYFIKNPLIQRGVNISAQYVFGRGFEVSSPDPDANEALKQFFAANQKVLGQAAITDLERRKYYDGNLFFCFFANAEDTGTVTVRTIDATEISEIATDPDDTDTPWYYHRIWSQRVFDPATGQTKIVSDDAYYPALGYEPATKPQTINDKRVMWKSPVYHRKCGAVSKWLFGCPLVYAALDWAKASKRFLEACATVKQSLAQISMLLTTKGGQAALEGAKQQLSTTVGPASSLYDMNPSAVNASIFASGPGSKLEAFKISGAGGNPEEVRQFKLQVCMVFGLPETFFGDVNTGNLATAQSLDRPTELNFLEKQEVWREDLCLMARYVLQVSMGAANGKLREAMTRRKADLSKVIDIREARRISKPDETVRYQAAAVDAFKPPEALEVMCTFPSIVEGDMTQLVAATVQAMTLGTQSVIGIDEKAGVRKLYELADIENGNELIEEQYPEAGADAYDPLRTQEPEPVPGTGSPGEPPVPAKAAEALKRLVERMQRLRRAG